MTTSDLKIELSRRYRRAETELGPGLRGKVIGAVHDFVRRYSSNPSTVARGYDRLAHLDTDLGQVLEIDVSRKDRLVGLWRPPTLLLLDVGGKSVVPRYSRSMLQTDVASRAAAPVGFYPSHTPTLGLFRNEDSSKWNEFAGENSAEWLYYLTPGQAGIVGTIRRQLRRGSTESPNRYFIVGGPGTGKTSVLLTLLVSLTAESKSVRVMVSNALRDHLEASGISIQKFRVTGFDRWLFPEFDVLLVDDPGDASLIQAALDNAYGTSRAVVVAFDPSQLSTDITDGEFDQLVTSNGVTPYFLRDCYRQKAVAGRAAKRVIDSVATSSPFLADTKREEFQQEHERVNLLSNELRFVNAGGVARVWNPATNTDLAEAAQVVSRRKAWGLPTPQVLVVVDEFTEATDWPWERAFASRTIRKIGFNDLEAVKGLEFQWVIIAIRATLNNELLDGFSGSSRRVYAARRLLRIPFTRARDGILTLVAPDVPRPGVRDAFRVERAW